MKSSFQLRYFYSLVMTVTLSVVFSLGLSMAAWAQDGAKKDSVESDKLAVGTLKEGLAKAKVAGMPLVVFGMTDT